MSGLARRYFDIKARMSSRERRWSEKKRRMLADITSLKGELKEAKAVQRDASESILHLRKLTEEQRVSTQEMEGELTQCKTRYEEVTWEKYNLMVNVESANTTLANKNEQLMETLKTMQTQMLQRTEGDAKVNFLKGLLRSEQAEKETCLQTSKELEARVEAMEMKVKDLENPLRREPVEGMEEEWLCVQEDSNTTGQKMEEEWLCEQEDSNTTGQKMEEEWLCVQEDSNTTGQKMEEEWLCVQEDSNTTGQKMEEEGLCVQEDSNTTGQKMEDLLLLNAARKRVIGADREKHC
ncbi:unnamed protein product [Pleuronectes platessa]|uniref:Uncharacterized protein n=1 Tax=Pleuronectes platessa TaxID=8262 RepID=A0A9N7YC29_PLEPL|nr:unnamed protein product [Pleuronectes platessa]